MLYNGSSLTINVNMLLKFWYDLKYIKTYVTKIRHLAGGRNLILLRDHILAKRGQPSFFMSLSSNSSIIICDIAKNRTLVHDVMLPAKAPWST
jgi:hypothetical protein